MVRTRRSMLPAEHPAEQDVGAATELALEMDTPTEHLGLSGRVTRSRASTSKSTTPAQRSVSRHNRSGKGSGANSESVSSVPTPSNYSSASEYSTPLTSIGSTPAPSISTDAQGGPSALKTGGSNLEITIPSMKPNPFQARDSIKALSKSKYALNPVSKRKRDEIDDSEDYDSGDTPDAKLARKLQEEEYAQAPAEPLSLASRASARPSKTRVASQKPGPASASLSKLDPESSLGRTKGRAGIAKRLSSVVLDSEDDEDDSMLDIDDDTLDVDDDMLDVDDASDSEEYVPQSRKRSKATRSVSKGKGKAPAVDLDDDSGEESYEEDEEDEDDGDDDGDDADDVSVPTPATTTAAATTTRTVARSTTRLAVRRQYRAHKSKKRVKSDRERLEEQHPVLCTMWDDLENMPVLKAGKIQQPSTISRTLKPFQLEGVAWMLAMERTKWKGGLLGDEMGLGKTIQAVSLIMSDYPAKKPSLVLAPPVALMQWTSEIESYTDGTLKTLVFHGTNAKSKNLTPKELKKYDVIIMSYNSLESMYRKQEKGFSRKDGVYKEKSIIHQTQFHRVILDEAHCIKTRTTMTAKACFALKVDYRWCLTGTPLQNRIGEFFSLIRFLEIRPFANYCCRDCPCAKLEWNMSEDNVCPDCKHRGMRHVSVFNQELLNPIQRYGNMGPGKEAFKKLRLLTDRIMLRRLKKDHTDSMELPVKEIFVDRQFFGEEENDFANSIMTNGQRRFDTYVAQGVLLNNYANIFGLIMQMRQVADHPDLILKKDGEGGQNVLVCCICDETAEEAVRSRCKHEFCRECAKSYVNSAEQPDCPRCHIPLVIDLEQPSLDQDEFMVKKSSIINRIKMENWTSSSKIELLVHDLHRLRSDNASHKSIIFSQFTTMLQLIEWRLRRAGITTVMLDGSMTPAQRAASIDHFMNNVDVECFLVSLKAGGVALNLTEASRVFIVDPWWNPAAEWQSADRCHRIGQTRPCTITRLCIEDSVESRMVLLQEKKTKMINSTINSDDSAIESLTPEDLQFLFRGS